MSKTEVRTQQYHASFVLDASGQWLAELEDLPQVHTYGRTLGKAREHLIDALALWLDIPSEGVRGQIDFSLPELPDHVQGSVQRALAERVIAGAINRSASDAVTEASVALVQDAHLSLRDAADVLGLSHQRVQQLVAAAGSRKSQSLESNAKSVDDIANTLLQFLPGGEKEELGVIAGAVAVGLAIAWIESRAK